MQFLQIKTSSYYDAGKQIGLATKDLHHEFYRQFVPELPWEILIKESSPYLAATQKYFPYLIEEMRGLADGIGMPLERVWAFNCRDEIEGTYNEKCSSVFIKTGSGWIVGHNEDDYWRGFQESMMRTYYFMVSKSISGNNMTYLACPFMIGGETVSMNSSGIIQTINTLHHANIQVGVPKNIIARAIAGADSIEAIRTIFDTTRRASGYCHTLLVKNNLYCIESNAQQFEFIQTSNRFVHTNHYLGSLSISEDNSEKNLTIQRCAAIKDAIVTTETVEELKKVLLFNTKSDSSIYREGDGVITMATTVITPDMNTIQITNENKGEETNWRIIHTPQSESSV
ncbi:MAG: C45 family peptidase [Microgenomates group bacterium]